MPPAASSINEPVAEPPLETRPEIVAPLEAVGADPPDAVDEGCAASGIDGDFEELHATAVRRPTTTAVSRKGRGAVIWLVLVMTSPASEREEATSLNEVRKVGTALACATAAAGGSGMTAAHYEVWGPITRRVIQRGRPPHVE
jgi:hypothetical protein